MTDNERVQQLEKRLEAAIEKMSKRELWDELQRTRQQFDEWRDIVHELVHELNKRKGIVIAINPVHACPGCGAQAVDYDGFGLIACPRDPKCYCQHVSATATNARPGVFVCDVCKEPIDEPRRP